MKFLHKIAIPFISLLLSTNLLLAQVPTISSFSPSSGYIGSLITITGTNLNNLDSITIGGILAIKISATSTSLQVMVMPETLSGIIYLKNSSGNVTSEKNLTILGNIPPFVQHGSKLVGTGGTSSAWQGSSISLSADGNTAIISGMMDNWHLGAAWIFTKIGGVWTQQGPKLVGTGSVSTTSVYQGTSVDISADGNTVIIGGTNDNSNQGAAWIFIRIGGIWIQQGSKLVGTGAVGAAAQGGSVSISADGNTAIVGGSNDNGGLGATWIYTRNAGIWSQQGNKLSGGGNDVSISADGNTFVSCNSGAVFYTRNGAGWIQQGNVIGSSYDCVDISADGNTAILGDYGYNNNQGAAWIYRRIGGIWSQQGPALVGTGSIGAARQGISVSISAEGSTAIVGGYYDNNSQGAIWVYKKLGSVWSQQSNRLVGSGSIGTTINQGWSVSISADANTVMEGGINDNNNNGAVWVFSPSFSTDANLSGLIISNGTLFPIFNSSLTNYSSSVSNSNTSITVTPTKSDSNATIQIRINGGIYEPINSGNTSSPLILNIGNNTIDVKVIAQNGYITKTYTINLNRNLIPPSDLIYSPNVVVSTRTINNLNSVAIYSGDSITSFSITPALPIGVTLNTLTGLIGGIPMSILSQTIYTITGNNSGGSITTNFVLTVNSLAPTNLKYNNSVIIASRNNTHINNSVTYLGDSITNFSINPALPIGVSLDTLTGLISGIPKVNSPQTTYTITGFNNGGSTTTNFTLTVNSAAPTNLKYNDSTIIANRSNTNIYSTTTYLGDSITNFSILPALPSGVILNTLTGLISGIPIVTLPKTVFTITGSNDGGSTTTNFTLTVNPALGINEAINNTITNIVLKPIPFSKEIEINFFSWSNEATKLIIIDELGKEVFTKTIQSNIGNNMITINEMDQLNTGIYFICFFNNNVWSNRLKIIKNN